MKKFFLAILSLFLFTDIALAQTFFFYRYREHATDCTALTDGKSKDLCYEIDSQNFYQCIPSAGDCSGSEWKKIKSELTVDPSGCSAGNFVSDIAADGTLTCTTPSGSGDITDVWGCSSGDCSTLTAASGDSLNAASATSIIPVTQSSSLPGTCTEGQLHQDTDSGGTETYVCTSSNTWTKLIAATDNVATATALASNPSDCSANQFATTIAASGNLTCASLTDGDIPDSITITLAATATALASNPSDCSSNQFANAIAASGNLTCAAIADADVPDTITVSNYLPLSGGTLTGSLVTDNLGIEFEDSDTNPGCSSGEYKIYADLSENKLKKCMNGSATDLDTTGGTPSFDTLSGGTNTAASMVVGTGASLSTSGSGTIAATTSVALAANGANCSAGQYPLGVDASGAAEGCTTAGSGGSADSIAYHKITSPLTNSGISFGALTNVWTSTTGTHTWTSAATADGFKMVNTSTYGASGSVLKLSQTGNVTGGAVLLIENSDSDSASIRTSPNNFSVSQSGATTATSFIGPLTGNASTATALSANGSNCSAGSFPLGVDASGASETCTALPTTLTGTANQISVSASTGAITLSIPTSPTLPGTTTGTFSGNLTGNVTGNSSTATALAANGSNCSAGNYPLGVDASGNVENCTSASGGGAATSLAWNGLTAATGNHGIDFSTFTNAWTSTTGGHVWTSTGTTQNLFQIHGETRTSGDVLKILVDNSMTTGKAIRVLGGASATTEIFNVDDAEVKMVQERTASFTVENLAAADDNYGFWVPGQNITLVSAKCLCQLGTCTTEADISFEVLLNGSTTVNDVTGTVDCEDTTTGDSYTALSGNVAVTAGDLIRFDVDNAVSPETDEYTISIKYQTSGN